MTRRARRAGIAAFVVLAAVISGVVALVHITRSSPLPPLCRTAIGRSSIVLDPEQAANATTIAVVAKRMGLVDHAVTVALAAALQESGLHNLAYGDLDSVGLFQQRPSQGWGTRQQILVPRYAAAAFYQRLIAVHGWETMAVTDAAQAVQHSAGPDAYAQWETEARLLAIAMTGEAPAAFACRFSGSGKPLLSAQLDAAMAAELGEPTTGVDVSPARGWTVASWLVAHASQYHLKTVAFDGLRWTPTQTTWRASPPARGQVEAA